MGRNDSINEKNRVKLEKVRLKKPRRTESKNGRFNSKIGRTDLINGKDRVRRKNVQLKKRKGLSQSTEGRTKKWEGLTQ